MKHICAVVLSIVAALVNVTDVDPEKPGFVHYEPFEAPSTPGHERITYTVDIKMKFVVGIKLFSYQLLQNGILSIVLQQWANKTSILC